MDLAKHKFSYWTKLYKTQLRKRKLSENFDLSFVTLQ